MTVRADQFCRLLIADPTLSPGTAYERAGYKARGLNAQKYASDLLKTPEVSARIAAARANLNARAEKSLESWIEERREDRQIAIGLGQMGAAVSAGVAEGKARGYLAERLIHEGETRVRIVEVQGPDEPGETGAAEAPRGSEASTE